MRSTKIRLAVFGTLISLFITTAYAAEKEPLENHVAIFNEMDANLRTADSSINATNHVNWMKTAIEAKRDLRQHRQIQPWLKELSITCSNDWRVLRAVALSHAKFSRSSHDASRHEQVRLMDRAYCLARDHTGPEELSRLIDDYISILFPSRTGPGLLNLKASDIPALTTETTYIQHSQISGSNDMIPPTFHPVPTSYESAANDGEIIRWLLANKPTFGYEPLWSRDWTLPGFAAAFAGTHHDVPRFRFDRNDPSVYEKWIYDLHAILSNLRDDQTVVWSTKNELKHLIIDLPQDYRYIDAYQTRAEAGDLKAAAILGNICVNRSQLDRAIKWYTRAGKTNEIQSICENQGRLTRHLPQLAGTTQTINYIYRNGSAVDCSIHPINQGDDLLPRLITGKVMGSELKLLEGDSEYFHKFNLAEKDGMLGPAITNWTVTLSPPPHHFSAQQALKVPALKAGFYLLRANMRDGNAAETVLHVYDTLLLAAKRGDDYKKTRWFLCDARTGKPMPEEPLHFFHATDGIEHVDRENGHGYKEVDGAVKLNKYRFEKVYKKARLITNQEEVGYMDPIAFADRAHPFLAARNTTGLWVQSPGYEENKWTGDPQFFVTSDRPVYRPGDTVHLKYWISGNDRYSPHDLKIKHKDTNDKLTITSNTAPDEDGDIPLDDYGGLDYTLVIPTNATLGTYEIRQRHDNSYSDGQYPSFRVEEYRAPELLLNASFTEDGKIELQAMHAYGEPLTSGTLEGTARFVSTPANYFHPSAPLDPAWAPGYWWNGNQFSTAKQNTDEETDCSFQFNLELNEKGFAFIDLLTKTNGPSAFTATGFFALGATIADSTGKKEERQAEVPTPPTLPPKLCCWLDGAFFAVDAPIVCHFARDLRLTPDRIEIRQHETLVQSIKTKQHTAVNLEPLTAGTYEARLISRDGLASRPFQFVVGTPPKAGLTADQPVRLVIEKGQYNASDTVQVMIQVDQPDRYVYLFPDVSEQFGFCEPQIIHMKQTSQIAEIELRGNGVLRCAALSIVDGKTYLSDQLIHIVTPGLDAGKIELTPSKKRYEPREEVSLAIKTFASNGAPRPCSVTVTVYNDALDLWAPWRTTSLVETLFAIWRDVRGEKLGTRDAFTRSLAAIEPKWVMERIAPKGILPFFSFLDYDNSHSVTLLGSSMTIGEDPTFNESTPPSQLQVRDDFRDLAYWNATILTDSNGVANVTFPMPDGLVKWKVQAWATHTNYAATATTSIECAKEFVSHLRTPRYMREGDELSLTTAVRNHTTNTLEQIAVNIGTEGVECTSSTSAKIEGLNRGVEAHVYWDLNATAPGIAEVTTKAWNHATSDGMKKTFPILPRGMLKRGGCGGVLAGRKTSETITINIPEDIDSDSLDCQLNVTPNMIDALANALPFLEEYPHGCAEQTLNRFLPALIVMTTLEELGGTVTNRDELVKRATEGYKKLMHAANSRDEWGWNLDRGSPRDPFISAWVVRGMRICDTSYYASISSSVVHSAAKRMLSSMEERFELEQSETNAPPLSNISASQAMMVSEFDFGKNDQFINTLPKEKQQILADYSKLLLAHADQLSLYGKVLLALAFENQNDATNRDKLIAYIEQYLERDAETGAAWLRTGASEFWRWYNDDIETQAWYLKLLNRVDPQGERAAGLARHLMLNRVHGDHWKSTRDTAIAIEALAEFAKNNQPQPGAAKPEITLNGKRLDDPANARLVPGRNTLTISSPSGAPLFHDVTWSYYTKENPITAETCELVTIDRKYYRPAEKKDERIEIKESDPVAIGERIEVELTIHARQHLEYLLTEDFKPAGFETVDQMSGYDGGAYRELHDERVSFYLHSIRKGETRLNYEVRAEFTGTVSAHPATVELMYAPRQAANAAERKFTIER